VLQQLQLQDYPYRHRQEERFQHQHSRRSFWSRSSSSSEKDPTGGSGSDGSAVGSATTTATETTESSTSSSPASVDETLDKLFQEQERQLSSSANDAAGSWFSADATAATADAANAADAISSAAGIAWNPTWYNLADQAIVAVHGFHQYSGMEYGYSIVGVTVLMRLAIFPLMVSAQKTTSRMAHLQPELTQIKARYEAIGTPSRQDQLQFSKQMKSLFAKYQVKPLRAFSAPLVQLPLFMGMFLGLKKMPKLFPEDLSTGGMLWFPDLSVADPLYVLPLLASGTFLILTEVGKDQMMAQNPAQGQFMVNVFRFLSITLIPVAINFESAMLLYWTANNVLTVGQTMLLKQAPVRKYFGIWDPPKPVPGQPQPEGLQEAATKLMKKVSGEATSDKQRIEQHNRAVETKKKAKAFQMRSRAAGSGKGITGKKS